MDLAGTVVVFGGKIHPIEEISISKEKSVNEYRDTLSTQSYGVVDSTEISGTIHSYRKHEMPDIGVPEVNDLYIFPESGGTDDRIVVTDTIVTDIEDDALSPIQIIDFVARSIEQ